MVGGKIIEVLKRKDGATWVNCGGTRQEYKQTCAVFLNAGDETLQPGDSLWWQNTNAYWTPRDRTRSDVILKRIGGSGVNRPKKEELISGE
jgi:hypothetical protein